LSVNLILFRNNEKNRRYYPKNGDFGPTLEQKVSVFPVFPVYCKAIALSYSALTQKTTPFFPVDSQLTAHALAKLATAKQKTEYMPAG
jgi:hypothetical protein